MKNYKKVGLSNTKHLNDEIGYYKECIRFLPSERVNDYCTSDAINYDLLREAGMKRSKALKFCTAHHCKIDSTQIKHGPPGLKIFKTKINKFKQLNGWQMVGRLNYEESMQQEYSDDTKWQIQVQNKEESKKLEQLKQFYSDLDIKYSFNDLSLDETITKLRSLSSEQNYKSRVPQHQIKDSKNNIMYYEMAEYILQLKKPQKNLISDLCAFDDSLPLARQEYYEIQPKRIKNATPLYSPQNYEKRSKLLKELTRAYTGNVTITESSEEINKVSNQSIVGYQIFLLD
ncbi:unnamed protein product [Paramecium octaurelia]|uniref:Uncharacterized protein n=1 Tax=Paramecium octaurelia TaxID=43137 RepID=A0A8S1XFP8_PAROT|nr:unnamed protein product [Paramecium octaurelia]